MHASIIVGKSVIEVLKGLIKSQLSSLDFIANRFCMKLLKTCSAI